MKLPGLGALILVALTLCAFTFYLGNAYNTGNWIKPEGLLLWIIIAVATLWIGYAVHWLDCYVLRHK